MSVYWRYFRTVVRHKYYAFVECAKAGIPLRGLLHDNSKFRKDEFIPYALYYEGIRTPQVVADYKKAVKLHKDRNPHHWENWVFLLPILDGVYRHSVDIHHPYDLEMVCDWRAAGLAYNGIDDSQDFYLRDGSEMELDPGTRVWVWHKLGLI